jgi:hypothetical protein
MSLDGFERLATGADEVLAAGVVGLRSKLLYFWLSREVMVDISFATVPPEDLADVLDADWPV